MHAGEQRSRVVCRARVVNIVAPGLAVIATSRVTNDRAPTPSFLEHRTANRNFATYAGPHAHKLGWHRAHADRVSGVMQRNLPLRNRLSQQRNIPERRVPNTIAGLASQVPVGLLPTKTNDRRSRVICTITNHTLNFQHRKQLLQFRRVVA